MAPSASRFGRLGDAPSRSIFRRTSSAAPEEDLRAHEREAPALIKRGLRNGEDAESLGIPEKMLAGYIQDIYRKLGISSRTEASRHAARLGLSEELLV